jgi:hypothetical protein
VQQELGRQVAAARRASEALAADQAALQAATSALELREEQARGCRAQSKAEVAAQLKVGPGSRRGGRQGRRTRSAKIAAPLWLTVLCVFASRPAAGRLRPA